MKRAVLLGCVLAYVLGASVAAASEHSKLLYSRGLVEFHAEHFDKALDLFDQAVAADGDDVYARYYRAVTRGRLKNLDGAIVDLEIVLKARPDLDQAALDLGVTLIELKRYHDALHWLRQAQRTKELAPRASLFLGLAQLRLGQLRNARANFSKAEHDPEQSLAAHYYQGVAAYQQRYWPQAKREFKQVVAISPDSVLGHEAAQFVTKLGEREPPPYAAYGSLGFQYDSNVILASDLFKSNGTRREDGRFTIGAGGTYVPWRTDSMQLALSYDFFQSLHFHLKSYNLQDHGPSIQLTGTTGPVQLGVLGRYDYYLRDQGSFLQEGTAQPWMAISAGETGRTEISYRMRRRDFKELAFAVRDAFNHAFGIRQYFYLGSPDRFLSVGYQFDHEDPVISARLKNDMVARSYGYDGDEVNAGVGWAFPYGVVGEATYAFRHERYAPESACQGTLGQRLADSAAARGEPNPCTTVAASALGGHNSRADNEHQLVATVRKAIGDHVDLTLAYFGDFNHSNDSLFEFDRHIGSVALEVRF